MNTKRTIKALSPAIPYIAVLVGVYAMGSALAAIAIYHAGMLALILACGRPQVSDKPRMATLPLVLLAVPIIAAGCGIYYLLLPSIAPTNAIATRLQNLGISHSIWPYFAVYFSLANAILEELFWRGTLGDPSTRLRPNDLLFGGYHALVLLAFASPIWTLPVFAACAFIGWFWRLLREKTGGLTAPILTHILADIGVVLAVHFRLFS